MKNFSSAFLWLTVSEIVFNLAGYVVHAGVGRILGPADYGRYGLVVTLTTMIIVLIGNGIPTAMTKYLGEIAEASPEKIRPLKRLAAKWQMILMGAVTLVFFLLSPFIAFLLRDPTLTPLFQISALIIPAFAAASFYIHYFNGIHRFRLQAILKIIRSFARIGFIVSLALFFGLPGSIAGYIAAPLLVFAVSMFFDFRVSRELGLNEKNPAAEGAVPVGTLLRYASVLTLFLVFYELLLTIDLYLVKALLQDDHLTGLYNAAITVGRIPYYLFYALAMILLPTISKSVSENNRSETESLVRQSLRFLAIFLVPMVGFLAIYAEPVLRLFYGTRYLGAAETLSVFTIGVGFLTVFYILAFALNGAGKAKTPTRLALFGFLLSLPLNFFLIPIFGIIGAAYATSIVSFALMVGILVSIERHFFVPVPRKTIFRSVASASIVLALARFVFPMEYPLFIFSGIALFAFHIFLLAKFGEFTQDDISRFRRIFGSRKA